MTVTSERGDSAAADPPVHRVWALPNAAGKVPAFYVESTSPENVEGRYVAPDLAERDPQKRVVPAGAVEMPDRDAIEAIAGHLRGRRNPTLVFLLHGFNNTRTSTSAMVAESCAAISADPQLQQRQDAVFIGYRWPTEGLGAPGRDAFRAASWIIISLFVAFIVASAVELAHLGGLERDVFPGWLRATGLPLWLVVEYVALIVLAAALAWMSRSLRVLLVGLVLAAVLVVAQWHQWAVLQGAWLLLILAAFTLSVGLFLLRTGVYFRDTYRAINNAVPDLLDFIRALNTALGNGAGGPGTGRVTLSFVGHSMGALVITQLIRVLSDVFAPPEVSIASPQDGAASNSRLVGEAITRARSEIGDVFRLGRLVLVAPDIPAETLMPGRTNSLKVALRRFDEAYIFSNEGDEVLRIVSTLANYFSFPTAHRQYGYRLGNAVIAAPAPGQADLLTRANDTGIRPPAAGRAGRATQSLDYGIVNPQPPESFPIPDDYIRQFLRQIRIGYTTLLDLHLPQWDTYLGHRQDFPQDYKPEFPLQFTYFDCTDYRDIDAKSATPANYAAYLPENVAASPDDRLTGLLTRAREKSGLSWVDHLGLLVQYGLAQRGRVDVHGGYLHGPFCRALIYRLAFLGFDDLLLSLAPAGADPDRPTQLATLSEKCNLRQIQVLLSPARFVSVPDLQLRANQDAGGPPGEVARRADSSAAC